MPNSLKALKEFFSQDSRNVSMAEMNDFWKSLSDEDKEYYKNADLS